MSEHHLSEPVVLAIDIGSSSTRAIPFDASGNAFADTTATRSHAVRATQDGGATLDALEVVEGVVACASESYARLGDRAASLRGVGISIFMHSWLGVDAQGEPTTPVIMWSDTRSTAEVTFLAREYGADRFHRESGCPPHTSYAPPKYLWLKKHDPGAVRRTRRWMNIGDFVLYRLFGSEGSSRSLASSLGLLRADTGDWNRDLLDFLGIAAESIPELVPHDTRFEGASGPYHQALGPAGLLPWFPASGDGSCSNVGSGGFDASTYALNLGTSGALRVLDRSLPRHAPEGLWCYLTNDDRPFIGGAITNAGSLFAWLCDRLRLEPGDKLEAALATMEPDSHGLTMLPFLMGERSVGWRGDATAAIVGLRGNTSSLDILRAGLETVALRIGLILERLRPVSPNTDRIVAGGGVTKSAAWMQIMSDVLEVPLYESEELEASARGAAVFALHALGDIPDLSAVPARLGRCYEPRPWASERYRAARARHADLYGKLVGGIDA